MAGQSPQRILEGGLAIIAISKPNQNFETDIDSYKSDLSGCMGQTVMTPFWLEIHASWQLLMAAHSLLHILCDIKLFWLCALLGILSFMFYPVTKYNFVL